MNRRSFGARFRLAALVLGSGSILVLAGCGSDFDKPKLGKVHGKVTYKGQPVQAGRVVFTPAQGKGGDTGQTATGEINSDGTYDMTTFNTGDGAILGQHIVTVIIPEKGSENMGKPKADSTIEYKLPKNVAPSKYASPDKSPLRCTVVDGGMSFDIELKD